MFALGPCSRGACAGAALAAFAAAFAAAPLVARGSARTAAIPAAPSPSPPPAPFAIVLPRRDPFAGGVPPLRRAVQALGNASAPAARTAYAAPGFALPFAVPGSPGLLVPGAPLSAPSQPGPRVTAVVTGAHPSALVEEGAGTRVVTVGDALAGDRVRAIAVDGVRLEHGALLPLGPLLPTYTGG